MQTIKVLVSGTKSFMQHAIALTTGYSVKSRLHEESMSDDDEWTEFAVYVLEGTREDIDEVDMQLQQIAAIVDEELYGGELGEI